MRGPLPLPVPDPRIERAQCDDGGMATTDELLVALDRRLLEAIESKATSDTILKLAEARAWLSSPAQSHGAPATVA